MQAGVLDVFQQDLVMLALPFFLAALVVEPDFDPRRLYAHLSAELPGYALPRFLRLVESLSTTGTFKHKKVELREEGWDPERVSDPLLLRDIFQPDGSADEHRDEVERYFAGDRPRGPWAGLVAEDPRGRVLGFAALLTAIARATMSLKGPRWRKATPTVIAVKTIRAMNTAR